MTDAPKDQAQANLPDGSAPTTGLPQEAASASKSTPPSAGTGGLRGTGQQRRVDIDPDFEFGAGTKIGEYIADKKIGEGGMGEVWLGTHPLIGKKVAIKLLNRDFVTNKEVVTRFVQEARAVNEIKHRNLIDIFSFGDLPDGRPYFVMEFLDGKPLSKYIKTQGPLPFGEIVDLFGQACRALQAAHDRGIIHRDLKPDNLYLILEEGSSPFLKVLDFGIAKLATKDGNGEGQNLTRTGAVFGTPAYMSPEQCEGAKAVDHRSDIYALGIILFEMITGRTPFSEPGDGIGSIMMKHMSLPAPAPSTMVAGRQVPPTVDAMVLRALSKEPGDRPARCLDLFDELKKAVGSFRTEEADAVKGAAPIFGPRQSLGQQLKNSGPQAVVAIETQTNQTKPGDYYAGSQTGETLVPTQKRGSGVWIGAGVGAALLLAVGLYVGFGGKQEPPPLDPVVAAGPDGNQTPPPPEPPKPDPIPVPEPPKAPESVKLNLVTEPPGAKVLINGQDLGVTPLTDKSFAYGEAKVDGIISLDGHEPLTFSFTPNAGYSNAFVLKKAKGPDTGKKPDPKGTKPPVEKPPVEKPPVEKPPSDKPVDKDATLDPFGKKK